MVQVNTKVRHQINSTAGFLELIGLFDNGLFFLIAPCFETILFNLLNIGKKRADNLISLG